MAVDYLKTYLGIDPDDYSAMEARIRGEEPQARVPFMRQPMMMPQQRSLGDIEAMPMLPRSQPVQQDHSKYDDLMAQIASLKAQIEGMQAATEQVATEQAPVMAPTPAVMTEPYQAPVGIENRMVGEPEPFVAQEPVPAPTPALDIPQARAEDIQASIDMLANLPKMNIPQIPDIEQIRQKMEEANMTFPEPVSYQDQLQSIRDLPPMPNNFMGDSARNVMSQIQQPQMQSFGRPQLPFQGGFMPEMRAGGGGIDKAIYDLKFKLNG